jgi:hypothetical protein
MTRSKMSNSILLHPVLPLLAIRVRWYTRANSQNSSVFLFLHSYMIMACCIVFICLLCALRSEIPCRSHCSRIFRSKSLKSLMFSLACNKASVLDQLCTYYFSIYSVVCRNCMIGVSLRAPILETSRT